MSTPPPPPSPNKHETPDHFYEPMNNEMPPPPSTSVINKLNFPTYEIPLKQLLENPAPKLRIEPPVEHIDKLVYVINRVDTSSGSDISVNEEKCKSLVKQRYPPYGDTNRPPH